MVNSSRLAGIALPFDPGCSCCCQPPEVSPAGVQLAISGADWLPSAWHAVLLLLALSLLKILAASLTIGSGGSAGDFAPSLAIGGLLGGAFGRAAALLLGDPRIDPGAFALVGMAAFYGGIAHVPLASLVIACELAGNYDLLVPLMLALGISFAALVIARCTRHKCRRCAIHRCIATLCCSTFCGR